MIVVWMLAAIVFVGAAVLTGLAVLARRQSERQEQRWRQSEPTAVLPTPAVTGEPEGPPAGDEWAELVTQAETRSVAAQRALADADQARQRVAQVDGVQDEAEQRYLLARLQAQTAPAGEPEHLVQRAAVDAYRRGQLSAAQLDRIWRHVRSAPPASPADVEPVRRARRAYELAVAEVVQVRQEAHVAAVAADVLAEEARRAENDVAAAVPPPAEGLAGLFEPESPRPQP